MFPFPLIDRHNNPLILHEKFSLATLILIIPIITFAFSFNFRLFPKVIKSYTWSISGAYGYNPSFGCGMALTCNGVIIETKLVTGFGATTVPFSNWTCVTNSNTINPYAFQAYSTWTLCPTRSLGTSTITAN